MEAKTLNDLIRSYWLTQAIGVAAELDIADRLTDGPLTAHDLAELCGVQSEPLYRVLRALASAAIFREDEAGRFHLTPLARQLRRDAPGGQRAFAMFHHREFYRAWAGLLESVRTGQSAFTKEFGQSLFDYLEENPDRGHLFDGAMSGAHDAETLPMLDAYDFSGFDRIVDVGGGNGSVLSAILDRYAKPQCVLFDMPDVAERAKSNIGAGESHKGCSFETGSFFDAVPENADAYLLRHIVHDWDDDEAVRILSNCRRAGSPNARILVVETVIPRDNAPFLGKWRDLSMLVIGGRERTAPEYERLFQSAGLRVSRIVPTRMEISIVEGVTL